MHATPEPLYTAAKELHTLYHQLADLAHNTTATTPTDPDTPTTHTFHYQEPWNTPAAHTKMRIHADVRRYVTALEIKLFQKATYYGTTDTITVKLFDRLALLTDTAIARKLDDTDITDAARLLTSWPRHIRLTLGIPNPGEEPWTKVPGDLRCPQCDRRLYLQPGWRDHPERADAVCAHCRDEDGRMLSWPAETWTLVLQQV